MTVRWHGSKRQRGECTRSPVRHGMNNIATRYSLLSDQDRRLWGRRPEAVDCGRHVRLKGRSCPGQQARSAKTALALAGRHRPLAARQIARGRAGNAETSARRRCRHAAAGEEGGVAALDHRLPRWPMYVPLDTTTAARAAIVLGAAGPWRLVELGVVDLPDASGPVPASNQPRPLGNAITIPKSGADAPAQGVQVPDLRSGGTRPTDARSSAPNEPRSASAL
jgi:hypothetical protein